MPNLVWPLAAEGVTLVGEEPPSRSSVRVDESGLMQSMTHLLEAQRDMMAVQVKALSAQSLPPLRQFIGEENLTDDETFEC